MWRQILDEVLTLLKLLILERGKGENVLLFKIDFEKAHCVSEIHDENDGLRDR